MTQSAILKAMNDERTNKGISYKLLGEISGIGPLTVWQWMNGKSSPTLVTLLPVLDTLGLELKVVDKHDRE